MNLKEQYAKENNTEPHYLTQNIYEANKYIEWLEQRLKASQHETIVMCEDSCCWHRTGTILTCDPPLYEEICCHCGKERSIRENRMPDTVNHGKFHPDKIVFKESTYRMEHNRQA